MLFGMLTQIFCGCICGLTSQFEVHIFFRYLAAVACAQMYTAGQMICKACAACAICYRTTTTRALNR